MRLESAAEVEIAAAGCRGGRRVCGRQVDDLLSLHQFMFLRLLLIDPRIEQVMAATATVLNRMRGLHGGVGVH